VSSLCHPPPEPPYDVETIEPLEFPPVSIWAGETDLPPSIWWECGIKNDWKRVFSFQMESEEK
jgi:hypothetical protein